MGRMIASSPLGLKGSHTSISIHMQGMSTYPYRPHVAFCHSTRSGHSLGPTMLRLRGPEMGLFVPIMGRMLQQMTQRITKTPTCSAHNAGSTSSQPAPSAGPSMAVPHQSSKESHLQLQQQQQQQIDPVFGALNLLPQGMMTGRRTAVMWDIENVQPWAPLISVPAQVRRIKVRLGTSHGTTQRLSIGRGDI